MAAPLALSVLAGCTRNQRRTEPQPTVGSTSAAAPGDTTISAASQSPTSDSSSSTASTNASSTSAAASTPAASTWPSSDGAGPTPTATESLPASPAPPGEPSATDAAGPSPAADGSSSGPDAEKAARVLLVKATDLGPGWLAEAPEDDHERGDICGNVASADKNRLLGQAIQLTNDNVEGAAVHEIARYRPGTAVGYAQSVDKLLGRCNSVKRDFDGALGAVTAQRTGPASATYTVTFDGGVQTFGAIAVTVGGDYVSTTTAYAANTATAARIVAKIDAATRRAFAARNLT